MNTAPDGLTSAATVRNIVELIDKNQSETLVQPLFKKNR
jgi:hypothetical protein